MKSKIKPRPFSHAAKCATLCNRLQADDPAAYMAVATIFGLSGSLSDNDILTAIGNRVHLAVHTSMGSQNLFVAKCSYQDGTGYKACLQPAKYSISSSPKLIAAATLSYIQLCKQVGRFI